MTYIKFKESEPIAQVVTPTVLCENLVTWYDILLRELIFKQTCERQDLDTTITLFIWFIIPPGIQPKGFRQLKKPPLVDKAVLDYIHSVQSTRSWNSLSNETWRDEVILF